MKTIIISAFPGTGKTHFFEECKLRSDIIVLDSDSSKFDKSEFPANYISHIKEYIGKTNVIFVSSHKEVREALIKNGLSFDLVYPDKSLKEEYFERYKQRGSSESFVKLLDDNWEKWISELDEMENELAFPQFRKVKLTSGQYISDHWYLKKI